MPKRGIPSKFSLNPSLKRRDNRNFLPFVRAIVPEVRTGEIQRDLLRGTPNFTLQFGRRYFASVDLHRSKRTKSFQFGAKSQIASGQSKNAECFRILTFNNCFIKFSNRNNPHSEDTQYPKNLLYWIGSQDRIPAFAVTIVLWGLDSRSGRE